MATLREVRKAIEATLKAAIPGLNVTQIVGMPAPPSVVIRPQPFDYLMVFGNTVSGFEFALDVVVGTNEEFVQDKLDDLVDGEGDRSIVAALLTNSNLGRDDCSVRGPINLAHYGSITFGETAFVGARITFGVIVTRS